MAERARALHAFYYGPVWQAHREAANATMLDKDDVLLLRGPGFTGGRTLAPVSIRDQASAVGTRVFSLVRPASKSSMLRAVASMIWLTAVRVK